jgi:hypothetical protein
MKLNLDACVKIPASPTNPVPIEWHVDGDAVRRFRLWASDVTQFGCGRAARIGGNRRCQFLIRLPAGLTVDCGKEVVRAQLYIGVGDMKIPPASASCTDTPRSVLASSTAGRSPNSAPRTAAHILAQPPPIATRSKCIGSFIHLCEGPQYSLVVARRDAGS